MLSSSLRCCGGDSSSVATIQTHRHSNTHARACACARQSHRTPRHQGMQNVPIYLVFFFYSDLLFFFTVYIIIIRPFSLVFFVTSCTTTRINSTYRALVFFFFILVVFLYILSPLYIGTYPPMSLVPYRYIEVTFPRNESITYLYTDG